MTHVLITGGMGAIGSWVTRKLVERGDKVSVYQRNPATNLLTDIIDKFEFIPGDVLDLPKLTETIKSNKIERIIHMAGLVHGPLEANPFLNSKVNIDGAMNIFEASRLLDIKRVVYISSKAVYDEARGEYAEPTCKPITEDYPKNPSTVYGITKLYGEYMGLSFNRIYGLDFIALRFASTYGPGKQTRHSAQAVASPFAHVTHSRIIEHAMLGKPLKIVTGGDQLNDMVYNRDLGNGIVQACFVENPKHRIFHLGSGTKETLRHAAEIVNKIFGEKLIEVGSGPGKDHPLIMDISRAKQELGYSPQYSLESGIKDYIATLKRLNIAPVAA